MTGPSSWRSGLGLAIEVLSSFTGQPGTIVCAEESGT